MAECIVDTCDSNAEHTTQTTIEAEPTYWCDDCCPRCNFIKCPKCDETNDLTLRGPVVKCGFCDYVWDLATEEESEPQDGDT